MRFALPSLRSSAACLPLLLCAPLVCQDAPDERPETYGHSHQGDAFDEGPRSAAYLMPGMSDQVHFPVEGLCDEAQRFFDQGICQQHGFWYFEAERSFRQVAKLHPDCAMAYWGMARANDENAERAAGFLCKAVALRERATKREQAWIDAWARFYRIGDDDRTELQSGDAERVEKATAAVVAKNEERKKDDRDKLQKRLLKDLGTIVYEYPDDIEAKAFLAVQTWLANGWGSGVEIVSHTAVDALLDQVFAKAPLHPAHHYRIHLWDREDARRALDSASKNGSTAPAIAHQWHMPGHIYAKLHRHGEAAWQQEASSRADHAHMMRDSVMPFLIHNYAHNQEWLARSLGHCGRVEDALEIACNLAELPRHPVHNKVSSRRSAAGFGRERIVELCEDHGLWQRAIELVEAGYVEKSDDVASEIARLRLLGRAYFRLGREADGLALLDEVRQLVTRARAERSEAVDAEEQEQYEKGVGGSALEEKVAKTAKGKTSTVHRVLEMQRQLEMERLLAAGETEAALKKLDDVNSDISTNVRADVLLAAGKVEEAIDSLEAEAKRHPNQMATLAALFRARQARYESLEEGEEKEGARAQLRDTMVELMEAPDSFLERLDISVDAGRRAAGGTPESVTSELAVADGEPLFPDAEAGLPFGDDFGARPPLDSIGPRTWRPVQNAGFDLPVAGVHYGNPPTRVQLTTRRTTIDGDDRNPAEGRATLVVFYLGFGCLHCVEQLHALRPMHDAFAAAGIDIVAIGTDTSADTWAAMFDLPEAERMPFPMLCDPELEAFRAWRCHDDFEDMPLHGTFLVDANGLVRWQDVSYEPFMEIAWLLDESRRLLALPSAASCASAADVDASSSR